jgi:hypothetical protein
VKSTGRCEADPCLITRCPAGDRCLVQPDGTAQCTFNPSAPGAVTTLSPAGGGLSNCTCRLGAREQAPPGASLWLVALLGLGLVIRGRRGRR